MFNKISSSFFSALESSTVNETRLACSFSKNVCVRRKKKERDPFPFTPLYICSTVYDYIQKGILKLQCILYDYDVCIVRRTVVHTMPYTVYSTFNNDGKLRFLGLRLNPIEPYIIRKLRT
jgi:hypothetical protein